MMIGSKSHEGKITLFSNDSKTKTVKQPWGSIHEMKYPVNLKDGDEDPMFGLKNKQGSNQAFRRSWLDPGLWKIHPFTTKWMSMRAEGREATLAKFVTVLVRTKFFVAAPCEEKFDEDGIEKESILCEAEREEFLQFLSEAQNAATLVDSLAEIPSLCNGSYKRKQSSEKVTVKKVRLTKAEEVNLAKQTDLNDNEGIEVKLTENTKGRYSIHLNDLSNSVHLEKESPINPVRVASLAKSMDENFDLSQMCFIVCPNCEDKGKFVVISGRYRFEALKKLASEGKLAEKKGMENGKVLCVLLTDNSPGNQSYVQNRSNKIQANVRGFSPDSLLFTILNLRESLEDKEKVAETIRRYAVNLEVPAEEVTQLKRMSHWPQIYTIL